MPMKYSFLIMTVLYLQINIIYSSVDYENNYSLTRLNVSSEECCCAWCPCLPQPLWAPTSSDCRFYPCCKPCVFTSDCLETYDCCGKILAVLCCPCVVRREMK